MNIAEDAHDSNTKMFSQLESNLLYNRYIMERPLRFEGAVLSINRIAYAMYFHHMQK
jgi:hypothetical protein